MVQIKILGRCFLVDGLQTRKPILDMVINPFIGRSLAWLPGKSDARRNGPLLTMPRFWDR